MVYCLFIMANKLCNAFSHSYVLRERFLRKSKHIKWINKAVINSIQKCISRAFLWKQLHRLQIKSSIDFAGHDTSKNGSALKGFALDFPKPCYYLKEYHGVVQYFMETKTISKFGFLWLNEHDLLILYLRTNIFYNCNFWVIKIL